MIEFELLLNDLQKMRSKEKSIRNRLLLEKAIDSLEEYEKATVK